MSDFVGDHIGQGGGAAEAPFLGQVLLNLAGDAARQALLAVGIDQIGQLVNDVMQQLNRKGRV